MLGQTPMQWDPVLKKWTDMGDDPRYTSDRLIEQWEYIPKPSWDKEVAQPLGLMVPNMKPSDLNDLQEELEKMDQPELPDEPPSLSPVEVIQKLFNMFDEPPEGLTMNQINGAWEWVKYAKHVMETQNDLSNIRTEALKIELAKREPQPDDPEQAAAFCSFCDNKGHTRDRCPHLASAPMGAAPLLSEIENCQHIRVVGRSGQVTCKRCGANLSTTPQPNRFGF